MAGAGVEAEGGATVLAGLEIIVIGYDFSKDLIAESRGVSRSILIVVGMPLLFKKFKTA